VHESNSFIHNPSHINRNYSNFQQILTPTSNLDYLESTLMHVVKGMKIHPSSIFR